MFCSGKRQKQTYPVGKTSFKKTRRFCRINEFVKRGNVGFSISQKLNGYLLRDVFLLDLRMATLMSMSVLSKMFSTSLDN